MAMEIDYSKIDTTILPNYTEDCDQEECFQDTLGSILDEIKSLRHRAEHLATSMRLKPHSLPKNPELRDVIDAWLRGQYNTARHGPPTWRLLIEKVADDNGGANKALAKRLASKYQIGCSLIQNAVVPRENTKAVQESNDSQKKVPITPPLSSQISHPVSEEAKDQSGVPSVMCTSGSSQSPTSASSQFPTSGSSQSPPSASSQFPTSGSSQFPTSGSSQLPTSGNSQFPTTGSSQFPTSAFSSGIEENRQMDEENTPKSVSSTASEPLPGVKQPYVFLKQQPVHPPPQSGQQNEPDQTDQGHQDVSRQYSQPSQVSSGAPLSSQISNQSGLSVTSSDLFPSNEMQVYSSPVVPPGSILSVADDGKKNKQQKQAEEKLAEEKSVEPSTPEPVNTLKDKATGLKPYKMNKGYHGYALIINNVNIAGRDKRLGAEKDDENLSKTLNMLGYHLYEGCVYRDKTADEIRKLIEKVCKQTDHTQCDSFVCCLLSHGDSGKIYGVDDRPVYLDELKQATIKCKSLVMKPKIFLIQSCRGGRLPDARAVQIDDHEDTNRILLPEESDLFFGYATTPFTKACRFTDIGSWYVIELCKALNHHYKELDLLSMVQLAHYEVATNPNYVYEREEKDREGQTIVRKYKQSPQMVSTLIRPLYF